MARSFWDTYTAARVSRRRVLQSAGTAAAAGAAVWVVGCGGDDNGASSGSTSTPAAAPTSNLDFGTSSNGAVAGGTFNAASSLDFATFDPHLSVGSSQAFFPRLYNAIINRSPNTNDFEFNDLAESLEQPDDVTYVAISHTHGDHVGNIALFPSATVLIQAAEYDWAMAGPAKPAFTSTQIIKKVTGDHDVFGDGSIKIISTPGHTPGHQSLLVNLPKTGALLLTGDAVHFQDNWTHRRVPSLNFNRAQTLASLERIAALLKERKAQLWINHDKAQSDRLKYAPAYYE